MSKAANFKAAIVNRAQELGFDACRFVAPGAVAPAGAQLDAWLNDGYHATMNWMEDTAARRRDPLELWPDVRSIIMLGVNYGPQDDPLENLAHKSNATISVYARNRDYHDLIKGRLKLLAQWLLSAQARQISGAPDAAVNSLKVFVDTAPVMEKPLAAAAGIGWQGKHTNLVSRDFGSWLFLGSIFTTLALEPDGAAADSCGSCQACLDICPTNAFPAPYQLDARRCISYLTIEHKGHVARTFRKRGLKRRRIVG
ncbi:MAG: tRNA epoxyqueuosine(34) reductase QueG, partial [Beijerinckiaceae bacterium]|nr:tRNA epoxyqueuosine(34) reductase QueG [Beijerinckiaceae bacterium]